MVGIRRVGIVGSGLAGLATALAAASAGASVHLFEAPYPLPSRVAHIHMVPNLLRDLDALGVADACARKGFPYQGVAVVDGHGRLYFDLRTPRLAGDHLPAAMGMVYGDLLDVVRRAAIRKGVTFHEGVRVLDIRSDGTVLTETDVLHRHDLTVLASVYPMPNLSGLEPRAFEMELLPLHWCQTLLPRPLSLERATLVIGHDRHKVMLVPVGARSAGAAILWSSATAPMAGEVRSALAAQGGMLRALAAHWTDATPMSVQPIRIGMLPAPWHERGVLRLGRNALQLPPHLGQAAAQAVEDAVVLGDLLRGAVSHDHLMRAFEARRVQRARQIFDITSQAARWDLRPDASTDLRALDERLAPLVARPA